MSSETKLSKEEKLRLFRQKALQFQIETHLMEIERELGPNYRLTLVARYTPADGKDADIVMTKDDAAAAVATIQKMAARETIDQMLERRLP